MLICLAVGRDYKWKESWIRRIDLPYVQSPASEIKEREGINSLLLNSRHYFVNQSHWTLVRSLWVYSV